MQHGGRVLEVDSCSGRLSAAFNSDLLRVLREARHLRSLGLRVGSSLQQELLAAGKFFKCGHRANGAGAGEALWAPCW